MRLSERLLKYAEAIVMLTRTLEETRAHIGALRDAERENRERIIRLETRLDALFRELELRDEKLAATLSRQLQAHPPTTQKR